MASVPQHDRPRERLLTSGPEGLSERELVAILLRSGTRGASALDVAAGLLAEFGDLGALASARPEELSRRAGIGPAKAVAVVAAFELGRRVGGVGGPPVVLRSVVDVAGVAQRELDGLRRERVIVMVCDSGNRLRRVLTVSDGAVDTSLLPVREVLNAVLRHDGRAFALAHNHPGGDPEPSAADLRTTAHVRDAAGVVGLRFPGHVVVGAAAVEPSWRLVSPLRSTA